MGGLDGFKTAAKEIEGNRYIAFKENAVNVMGYKEIR